MGYLVIKTATSGLFDFGKPADAPEQPRLAQIAMIYLDDFGETEKTVVHLIRRVGWSMSSGATAVNGITDDLLDREGVPVADVLNAYEAAIRDKRVVVSFNAIHDTKVMRAELRRAGRDDLFGKTSNISLNRPIAGIVKARNKRGGCKLPSLAEACRYFDVPLPQAHDALVDATATCALFHKLDARDRLPAPTVPRHKSRAATPAKENA